MLGFFIQNKSLKILIIINSVFILGASMFPPVFALFVKEIGGGAVAAGSIWAIFAIMTGVLTIIISRYGDRIKEKEYLVAGGYIFRIIAWTGYIFASSLWHLYLLQIALAIGESIGTVSFNAIYSEHIDGDKSIKQWGAWHSSNTIIGGIAALIGGIVVYQFGFQILFLIMASLAMMAFILLMLQPRKLL